MNSQSPSPQNTSPSQSWRQVSFVSDPVQAPSPHTSPQAPQSLEQLEQVSEPLQAPSPHVGVQPPQSVEQVEQVSEPLHEPSPQLGAQVPQSNEQLEQVSEPLQEPSPQAGAHAPQSAGQLEHDSDPPQEPSPQTGPELPQSSGQLLAVSFPSHAVSPQKTSPSQSRRHVAGVSDPVQMSSPQVCWRCCTWPKCSVASSSPPPAGSPHAPRTATASTPSAIRSQVIAFVTATVVPGRDHGASALIQRDLAERADSNGSAAVRVQKRRPDVQERVSPYFSAD